MNNIFIKITASIFALALFYSCEKADPPVITLVDPIFGPAETLVTFEGMNLANIETITFSDQIVNFNTAYNSDVALLFRVPTNVPLGDHEVVFTTAGGTVSTNFQITLDPPEIFEISPESSIPGDVVTIKGKNFYEPLEVYFFDSTQAEIITFSPDSMNVIVPADTQKGKVRVNANGGSTLSPVDFFITTSVLVNDFDGNGVRAATENWLFDALVDQNAMTAVQNTNPEPYEGNFLKLSGRDDLGIQWIGGTESYSADIDVFDNFGIRSSLNNTLLEMDVNTNGNTNTNVIFIFLERDGSPNDFAHEVKIDGEGWHKISIPLGRFTDIDGITVDPAKIRAIKIHLIDSDATGEVLELNIDNIKFQELL